MDVDVVSVGHTQWLKFSAPEGADIKLRSGCKTLGFQFP